MSDAQRAALARMSIFRGSSDAIIAFGKYDYAILTLNPSTESLFGYHGMDLLGYSVAVLFAERQDDPLQADAEPAGVPPANLFDPGPNVFLGRRGDGTVFPLEVVVTEAELGEESFYAGTFRDITDRVRTQQALKESEARFRAAVDALNE